MICALAVGFGTGTQVLQKDPVEIADGAKAQFRGDLRDRQIRLGQQTGGVVHTQGVDILGDGGFQALGKQMRYIANIIYKRK